ncbi:MAG TPA: SpoIIE family protein phosphatase [Actinomycetota bacterium]|nr:SpoIIE family protein phosphatase [Actinomycetota bacterium]
MGPGGGAAPRTRGRVAAFVVVLAAAAAVVTTWLAWTGADPPGRASWPALVMLGGVLIAAEFLFVRFRYGGEINALNLFEAALAPLVWAYPPAAVVGVVAGSQIIGNLLRRNAPIKSAFNVVQWSLAAALASATVHAIARDAGVTAAGLLAMVGALIVVTVVNQSCFSVVLALANKERLGVVLRGLSGAIVPGWVVGVALNSAVGVLFVLAFEAHPASVVLFPVPLIVLHLAYRGYAGARSDRMRLAGLHSAATVLAESFEPESAIEPFLRELARSFEARGAAIVLRTNGSFTARRIGPGDGPMTVVAGAESTAAPESLLLGRPAGRVTVRDGGPLAAALAAAGFRDCLSAPLQQDAGSIGALMVFDQVGLEGFEAGEVAVLEALARETAGVLAKGRLLSAIVEERQRLDEIVSATSDGIFTMDEDGCVRKWNPAMERITGISAADATGRAGVFAALVARSADGEPVDFGRWTRRDLPREFLISVAGSGPRRLSCSFSETGGEARARRLVGVVRDATAEEEMQSLRREFDQLTRMQRQQRQVVEQLQRAVVPPRPRVDGVQLGLRYQASETQSPTGGDLFDWQVLPDGEMHVVVVDVLGHGVAATNDAVSVIHVLRTLAVEGCPIEEMIGRADALLRSLNPDLVATVLIARIDPVTGHTTLAGGGHPPALHVRATGEVRQIPAPGGAIGWPHAGSIGVAETTLGPGDSLILYTDGLIEGTKDVLHGEESLMEHARVLAPLPADEIASGLIERSLEPVERRDDSLALVVRVSPPVERFSIDVEPGPIGAHRARIEAATWLKAVGVSDGTLPDVELALGELLANAAVIARTRVRVGLVVEPATVAVEVEDDGPGDPELETKGLSPSSADVDAGRGLFIVRAVSSSLSFLSTSSGTVVRAVLGRDLSTSASSRTRESRHA